MITKAICSQKKSILASVLVLFFIFALILSPNVFAGEKNQAQKVRVGWYNSDHFQEGSSNDEIKNGYSYEYLQSVANYTGWDYEYVHGGWSDLYDALLKGDIDLLAGLSYTEERAPLINYPSVEMGYESYYIYKKAGDEKITGSDPTSLEGKRVGSLENNLMTDFFEEWMKDTGIHCEMVMYNDFDVRDEAFKKGEIDAFIAVNNNVPSNSGVSPVTMVGKSSYYLGVAKGREDLLGELNRALSSLNESNPNFISSLQVKYFKNTAVNAALSSEESRWVKDHDKIRVGYVENYLPFCGTNEKGETVGVIRDIMERWEMELGLQYILPIEYVGYEYYTDMVTALGKEEIDVAFPINDNIWVSEQKKIVQTSNLVESSVYLIYRGDYNGHTTDVIALSDHSPFQRSYAILHYPNSQIHMVHSGEECLEAVKKGDATCTFFNTGRAEKYLADTEYEVLNRMPLGENVNYCLGVKKGNNVVYSLMARGVTLIDKSYMTNAMYKYVEHNSAYSLQEFIHDNLSLVLMILLIIIGLIVAVAVVLAISLKKTNIQKDKEQKILEITKKQKDELEEAHEELQEAVQRAESANRAKTTFLFNMSHDIRTPMNAILGFADLANKNRQDPEKVREYLLKIKSSGDLLMSILSNVLEVSRLEKGLAVLDEVPYNMGQLNDALYSMFNEQMTRKGIEFTRTVRVEHENIYCDAEKVRVIFFNLLSNAWKYTESGGEIQVSVEELPSDKEGYGLYKTVVRDTGRGMSQEFLPKVFELFAREKNSEKNRIEGVGLGLPMVKRLLDLMDGSIEVQSKEGEGSTFTMLIPFRIRKEDEEALEKTETMSGFQGKRLLLAEDMDINAEIAIIMLEEFGFRVDRAEDGLICLNKVKENPPYYYDAVLMDIQMPNMNGYQAAEAIRLLNEPGKSDIPIIAVTANTFEEDKKNAITSGMNGHVGKPISPESLIGALTDVL
ncbi:MAG: transporter substrate-binding domain-containing protein [Lachnospiraceae bacterium]|nr:transporter substrate-binding domain-containing protein [Lachnospiraceae bacterium]